MNKKWKNKKDVICKPKDLSLIRRSGATQNRGNLNSEDKTIQYSYDYNRLIAVMYPLHPENNVKYTYGNANASYNRVGKIMLQEDGSGAQEFQYDRLGNIANVRRTLIIPNQAVATFVTQWTYDSWNRLLTMTYPDEETVSYSYNVGGLPDGVKGLKTGIYNYVDKLGYDKFEQRTYMKYGNGAETNYSYDPQRRRLSSLVVNSTNNAQIMNNSYSYDAVDNVLGVVNNNMSHTYSYDDLYRLTSASGTYTGAGNKTASYSLEMAYDDLYNITSKKQHIQQNGIQFDGILKAGYELSYNYANNPFQLSALDDENYRTEGDSVNDPTRQSHAYEYDANGNLVYINTAREKLDGSQAEKSTERKLLWDEENRLEAVDDNGYVSAYWYDAAGERTVKESGDNESMYVNGTFSGGTTATENFTAYVNPYMVYSKNGSYTKHIYIGNQRIVSKLGDAASYDGVPINTAIAGGAAVDYTAKYAALQQTVKDRYSMLGVDYSGKDNNDYVNGQIPPQSSSLYSIPAFNFEPLQYFYHSDHLGSTSLITDLDGNVAQHVEYVPFGEVFIEERNNKWNTPYLFNAKELDEETGLYYYGARYYEPRASLWYGVDPMWEKYPEMSTYAYSGNNPIMFIDPTGMEATKYNNDKGELLYETNDGLDDIIIVPNANTPELEEELQKAQDEGTINNPETNRTKMHVLGQTPEEYSKQKLTGDTNWDNGYKGAYEKYYNGRIWWWIFALFAISMDEESGTSTNYSGGMTAGRNDGVQDRKEGKIDRLHPERSLKNNSPLLKIIQRQGILLYSPQKVNKNGEK